MDQYVRKFFKSAVEVIVLVSVGSEMRILGLVFSKDLLWEKHVRFLQSMLGNIDNLLRLICCRTKRPPMDTAVSICRSLAVGTVSHCITIYGWTTERNVSKINVCLNKCVRTTTGLSAQHQSIL